MVGKTRVIIAVDDRKMETECYILRRINGKVDMLLGDPELRRLTQHSELRVKYGQTQATAMIANVDIAQTKPVEIIEDHDMIVRKYACENRFYWEYEWRWREGPPKMNSITPIYWKSYDREVLRTVVQEWADRTLEPCQLPRFGIPINPVAQDKPGHPIRVTGDFKKLNRHIKSATTEESNEVCSRAIRLIRAYENGWFLDLSKAYQSVSLTPNLRDFNAFKIGDTWFRSKKMLFGIAIGQKVLYRILSRILGNKSINFRDDIFIPREEDKEEVAQILVMNGFQIKDGSVWNFRDLTETPKRILGLEVFRLHDKILWKRQDLHFEKIETCRQLAKALGQAASSHLPCIGKARAQVAILRSLLGAFIGGDHEKWDEMLPSSLSELWDIAQQELQENRPYQWVIPKEVVKYKLYTDASKFLVGGIIRAVTARDQTTEESDDLVDICKVHYEQHINIRELDAIIWGLQALEEIAPKGSEIEIITDSKSCHAWVLTAINDGIVRTKALYKSLIKTRIDIIKETLRINYWKTSVMWVESNQNPADALTRVPPRFRETWREFHSEEEETVTVGMMDCTNLLERTRREHEKRLHPGETTMTAIMKELCPEQEKGIVSTVKKVVANCVLCRRKRPPNKYVNLKSSDPPPGRPWEWVQADTLSVSHQPNLKVIIILDEYSKFLEYQIISGAPRAEDTVKLLTAWFHRYRPQQWHIKMDRGREFQNTLVADWIKANGGKPHYSSVRRPTACGMVERVNRTLLSIMRIAKHEYPDQPIGHIIRMAIHEYWNRPHRALSWHRPNEVVVDPTLHDASSEQGDSEGPEWEYPAEERSESDSENETLHEAENETLHEERSAEEPVAGNDRFFTPEPENVLMYDPPIEKLDLAWTPAKVIEKKGTATVVRPEGPGRHAITVNQRWIQPTPDQQHPQARVADSHQELEENSEGRSYNVQETTGIDGNVQDSIGSRVRSNRRRARVPERYM